MAKTPAPVRVMFFALILGVGCGGEELEPPPADLYGDGGLGGRPAASGGDGSASDAATDAPANLPPGVTVHVAVTSPEVDAIVKRAEIFKPVVMVDVAALKLADLPGVESVNVVLKAPEELAPRAPVSLGLVSVKNMEGAMRTFTFGDVAVPITDLPSGEVTLTATVRMVGGFESVSVLKLKIDAGPSITFVSPARADASFKASARIEVTIADPVFGPARDVEILLGTTKLEFQEQPPPDTDGVYAAIINFASFNPRLSGEQLVTVRARNKNDTWTVVSRRFLADDRGPTFTIQNPTQGQLVGGIIEIAALVEDPAGVNPDSVIAVVANGSQQFEVRLDAPALGAMMPLYTKLFDAKQLSDNAIFPTISFRAADKLGNESSLGYLLSFDKTPPLLDLDPPDDFRFDFLHDNQQRCSWPLDPVGPDAVDDGQLVNQAFDVRVRAEDQGNAVLSGDIDFVPIGGLKKVELLVLDDTARPLVVDSDADGKCDTVNPTLVPTTRPMNANDVLLLNLDPLPPAGALDDRPEAPPPMCPTGLGTAAPAAVCENEGITSNRSKSRFLGPGHHFDYMSVFLSYTQARLPSIWSPGPVRAGVECAGRQLEAVGSNLQDGWICLAALGEDTLGQKQVSRPLRVCVDKDGIGEECPHIGVQSAATRDANTLFTTKKAHGMMTGDEVFVQGVRCSTLVHGRHEVTVVDGTSFTIDVGGSPGPCGLISPWIVPAKSLPDCTGRQTQKEPMVQVDGTTCTPWRLFPKQEHRLFK